MVVAVGGPVRSSSVGAAFRSPVMMVDARRERRRYARLRASGKSLVFCPNGTCVSSMFSCRTGPTHSYAPRRPSTPRSGMGMHRDRRLVVEGHPPLPVGVMLVPLRVQDRCRFGLVHFAEGLVQEPQEVCALGVWPRHGL